jgi:hypothetical protein
MAELMGRLAMISVVRAATGVIVEVRGLARRDQSPAPAYQPPL